MWLKKELMADITIFFLFNLKNNICKSKDIEDKTSHTPN
jgi:hypothetical protein